MTDAVIEVENLTKSYRMGDVVVEALRGVSLRVERGEFLAIMGASGSGKSTLMHLLACLDRPTSGSYRLEGSDVSRQDERALAALRSRRIGIVFQSFNLLARASALENVLLPLFYAGRGTDGAALARDALRSLGLGDRERNHPSQLSGGQQQRVAIARALVSNPQVILADEPTGNLDSKTSIEVMALLQELGRSGITVVLVTHEPDISQYASRVVTMKDGLVLSDVRQTPIDARPPSKVTA